MPSLQQSGLSSILRILFQLNVKPGTGLLRDVKNEGRSDYVYENKGSMDKLTAKKSDISGNSTRILQRNAEFGGQFTLINAFRAGFVRNLRGENLPLPSPWF